MENYAIFLDIDGTLVSGGEVPKENTDAIRKAQAKGHKIFINSGRSMGFVQDYVKAVGFDGYVVGIGCYVTYGDELLLSVAIDKNEVAEMLDKFTSQGRTVILEGETDSFCNIHFDGDGFIPLKNGKDYLDNYSDSRITKFYLPYVLSQDEIASLEKKYIVFQHPNYLEYAPKGYSKATGMELILKKCNIPKERCVAMGDSANDVDMLRYAGISVAMGNASDEIKSICTKITAPANEGGVGKAICEILNL